MKVKLNELVSIYSGQIMSRVTAGDSVERYIYEKRVVIPKAIDDGKINLDDLPVERFASEVDDRRITKEGDIVVKLSGPYDSGLVTEEVVGCVIPSFCAIIRINANIPAKYLLAFLNSELCKEQYRSSVAGSTMAMLSVGKIGNVEVPITSYEEMEIIGNQYVDTLNKLVILKQICELERQRVDLILGEID